MTNTQIHHPFTQLYFNGRVFVEVSEAVEGMMKYRGMDLNIALLSLKSDHTAAKWAAREQGIL